MTKWKDDLGGNLGRFIAGLRQFNLQCFNALLMLGGEICQMGFRVSLHSRFDCLNFLGVVCMQKIKAILVRLDDSLMLGNLLFEPSDKCLVPFHLCTSD